MGIAAIFKRHAIWALPSALVILLYGQVLDHQYVDFDDSVYTYDNPFIAKGLTWSGVKWAFTEAYAANYHPLTWISHMLDFSLFGTNPGAEAGINAGLHALNAILVALLFRRLFGSQSVAIVIALVFVLHPKLVEAVAWISQRKTQLSTAFGLASILYYLKALHSPDLRRKYVAVGISLLFFGCSLLAKGMFVTMPLLLALLELIDEEQNDRGASKSTERSLLRSSVTFRSHALRGLLLRLSPFIVLSAIISAVTYSAQARFGAVQTLDDLAFPDRVGNTLLGYCTYLKHFVYPVGLSFYYQFDREWTLFWVFVHGVILIVLSFLFYRLRRKCGISLFCGWVFFLVALLPVIGLIQVGDQSSADRYMYQPIIGLLICVTCLYMAARRILENSEGIGRLVHGSIALWMVFAGFLAHRQISYWHNSYLLATSSEASIGPGLVFSDIKTTILLRAARYEETVELCKKVLKSSPQNSVALQNISVAEFCLGHTDAAIAASKRFLGYYPEAASGYVNLGIYYQRTGQFAEARAALEHAKGLTTDRISELHLLEVESKKLDFLEKLRRDQKTKTPVPSLGSD